VLCVVKCLPARAVGFSLVESVCDVVNKVCATDSLAQQSFLSLYHFWICILQPNIMCCIAEMKKNENIHQNDVCVQTMSLDSSAVDSIERSDDLDYTALSE